MFYIIIIIIISLQLTGCSGNSKENELKNQPDAGKTSVMKKNIKVTQDSLMKGDIFVTTGPAGQMNQKQGKIILIADSNKTLPIKLTDNILLAFNDEDSTTYRVKKDENKTILVTPDSDEVLKDGRMMLITDDGELLEVKILGGQMVVLTPQNTMLPLEKK